MPKREVPEDQPEYATFSYDEASDDSEAELASYSEDERFEDPAEFVDPLDVLDTLMFNNAAHGQQAIEGSKVEEEKKY